MKKYFEQYSNIISPRENENSFLGLVRISNELNMLFKKIHDDGFELGFEKCKELKEIIKSN